jgi:hypothetical protein
MTPALHIKEAKVCGSGVAGIYFPSLFESPGGWSKVWSFRLSTVRGERTHGRKIRQLFFDPPGGWGDQNRGFSEAEGALER